MATAESVAELGREVAKMQALMGAHEASIEDQKKALVDYIQSEFTQTKLVMGGIVEEARREFVSQRSQMQVLYESTAVELAALKERMEKAEVAAQGQGKGRLIQAKQMVPRVLTKQEEWKVWKSEVEDYCEVVKGGMKEALEAVKGQKEEVEERNCEAHWWKERSELWRLLKRYTEGGIKKDNGWEAWRKLH